VWNVENDPKRSFNGIDRLDLVENRFVGMKNRSVYQTAGDRSLWVITKFEEVAPGLSLTSQIRGPFGPASSPTALYVALIPHSPFIHASGVTLTKF
jgi:hypothetical protein